MEEEQNPLTNLSKLLLQLAFQTQGLAQRKDETQKMIQIYSREIAEEKLHIQEIKKKIEKLEEELIHRQKLVKQYKHNSKSVSMKQSSAEAQGQMESYGEENRHVEASLFSQQKKLQNMMTDEKKDEIREKDEAKETEEDVTDEKSKEKSMPPGSPLALVDTNNNSMRQYSEIKGQFISGCEELQVETKTQEDQLQLSGNKWNETNEREQTEEELIHFCTNQSEKEDETIYPQTPPARMKASSSTPTFTLQSPICSGDPESKSPGFLFSLNSNAQEAATFPEFNCDVFGTRSSHEEGNPFSFTSSYFSEKETKTALPYDNKEPGFLFDPMERGEEEEKFEFSFSSKSPVGCGDAFPFLFNSGKFQ
ncbi:golgin subfamily A member 6-like protein 25 isoform X3 [Lepisosteus oculatus]|uniref:golgin subfamily A member 6-like protein 25 isoform X3 n=1 Tax=Lepisosteus oculatus TaxID=7918 RepID=UPI0035F52753